MKKPRQSPLKSIRKFCLECCGGKPKSVRFCHDTNCSLWPLRFGKYPRTHIRKYGKQAAELFDQNNFIVGGKFDPKKPESTYKLGT